VSNVFVNVVSSTNLWKRRLYPSRTIAAASVRLYQHQ